MYTCLLYRQYTRERSEKVVPFFVFRKSRKGAASLNRASPFNQNGITNVYLAINFYTMGNSNRLTETERTELLKTLKARFEKNPQRHAGINWEDVQARLLAETSEEKLWSLNEMEETGGEPDVVGFDAGEYLFCDCSAESPKGRRSLCYDRAALDARKEYKPENSAVDLAAAMGIELLNESEYRELQKLGTFDTKTSSWVKTPEEIRKLGGAVFCDRRYNTVFLYHNGADSYYAARGFRGKLKV